MSLAELVEPLEGKLSGPDVTFSAVSTDTRTLERGELYVALKGPNFDGNSFLPQAAAGGACGAIVSVVQPGPLPQLQVTDTTVALGRLGRLNRRRSQARVLALTGSQGKTTVKEMTGAILSRIGQTLVTRGNLNNAIGVPLTLLALRPEQEFAVVELGASTPGEIAYSVNLVEPDIGLITNAAGTHLEGFGSLDAIVRTKGDIISGVNPQGTVILNADDAACGAWIKRTAGRRVVTFSLGGDKTEGREHVEFAYSAADIRQTAQGSQFLLCSPKGSVEITLPLLGRHNVANGVAAAALAMEAGADLDSVVNGLAGVRPVKGRLCRLRGHGGGILIDDSYNASPSSFRAAIDVLAAFPGTRILVMGDMGELGADAEKAHAEVGRYAATRGIDSLWSVGRLSEHGSTAFGSGGVHFPSRNQLVEKCMASMDSSTAILIKGSRSAKMDMVVDELKSNEGL